MRIGRGWRRGGGGGVATAPSPALLASWRLTWRLTWRLIWRLSLRRLTRCRRRLLRRQRLVLRLLGAGSGRKRQGEKHRGQTRQTLRHKTVSHALFAPCVPRSIGADGARHGLLLETATAWRRP